jgi:signal transduction histidine kinase
MPKSPRSAGDEVSTHGDPAAEIMSRVVSTSAWRSEQTLAIARVVFCGIVLVRSLLVTTLTLERVMTGVPPVVAALAFSLYVLRRRQGPRVGSGFFVLSVSFDAAACFAALLPMALWPELSRVPLLDKADISALLLVVAASAFRHSTGACLISWLLNTLSFTALMHWDRAVPWTSVERNVALLYFVYLVGAGSMAVLLAARTRKLVTSSARAALEVDRAQRNLALVLREHHDLRSQLAAATLNADLAHRELATVPAPGLASFVNRVRQSLTRINGAMVAIKERSYEELARLEASRPADLTSVANAVRGDLERLYPSARFELRALAGSQKPWVAGGSDALYRVLLNLATNACEGSGGRSASRVVVESSTSSEGNVAILVRDDGPGFSTALLAAAGRVRLSSKPDGFGLGLALVRAIVETSGGTLQLANDEEGARVTIVLPARQGRSVPRARLQYANAAD